MRLPRFQFRLRTLIFVVTLLAVPLGYVGWQVKIVRERKAMLDALDESGGGYLEFAATVSVRIEVPAVRRWLGDRAIETILIRKSRFSEQAFKFQTAFPEANVELWDYATRPPPPRY